MRRILLVLVVLFPACHVDQRQPTGVDFQVQYVFVTPDSSTLDPLGVEQFQAYGRSAGGESLGVFVQWSASAGSITSDAVYTADTSDNDVTIMAQLGGGPDAVPLLGTAIVHKRKIVDLFITPRSVTLQPGASQQFTAYGIRATGDTVPVVATFTAAGGTITPAGLYTAGAATGGFNVIASRPRGLADTAFVTIAQVPVAAVIVNPAAMNLAVGGTSQLTATTKDAAGNVLTGRAVTWSSNASGVASVAATGVVSGVSTGSATITATSEGQNGSAMITVLVVPVATVQLMPASANLRVGTTSQFNATTRDSAGNMLAGRVVTWSTDASSVATVSASGVVSAVAVGSANIAATSEGKTGASSVTVSVVPVASVAVTPSSTNLRVGGSAQLSATAKDSAGNVLNGRNVSWSSSASGVASVSATGLVSAVAAGSATITATSEGQNGTAAITVTVVPVASVTVSPSSAALHVGGTVQLAATTKDSANNVLSGRTVTWSSTAPSVASVSASGLVTALAVGSATITATSEGKSATAAITITVVPVAAVTVTPSNATLRIGTQVTLVATTRDSAGNVLTGRTITWSSNASSVASVSASGVVSALAQGSASVTATSEGKSATATITVTVVPVASVTVTPASASLNTGLTQQLSAATEDSAGNVLTGRTVTWASNATSIASVSASGLVSALAAGSATITATSEGKSGSAAITVTTSSVSHSGWYVSPSGSSGGDGSSARPWDLQTGFNGGNGKVQPGDTVWLRGGTYTGAFSTNLNGTAAAPIVVRQYPGERATIDGGSVALSGTDVLTVNGSYTWYWGFEIMDSNPQRNDPNAGTGTPLRGDGVYVNSAHDIKLINLIVHDTGHGTYTENAAHNIEIYGWVIYNGGTESSSRSDGHGIYIKGDGIGWKIARDNVIFDQFGFGVHGYAQSGTTLKQLVFDGNVLFNNGTPSDYENPNMQLGGSTIADNDTVTNNMTYYSPGVTSSANGNVRIGYSSTVNGAAVFEHNYIAGGTLTLDLGYWTSLTVQANTILASTLVLAQHDPSSASTQHWSGDMYYHDPAAQAWQFTGSSYNFANWESYSAAADQASATMPVTPQIFVRPNRYEPGRATIVVYNWPLQSSVSVDLTGIVKSGSQYQLRNVQDIFGTPVMSGTYTGGTISIPMGGVNPPQPIGGSFQPLHKTGPNFDVFVVTSAP